MSTELLWRIDEIRGLIDPYLPVRDVWFDGGRPAFAVDHPGDLRLRFEAVRRVLEPLGLLPALRRRRDTTLLLVLPAPAVPPVRYGLHLLLFLATLATTLAAGYLQALPLVEAGYLRDALTGAAAYAVPLMAILLTHEMGHKVAAARRGVQASLPYFIPMIPPVGTMGAVIVTRRPAPDRDSLMDLGASGPIAGFLLCLPVLAYGIRHSYLVPPLGEGYISFPDPLLVRWLTEWLLRPPEGLVVLGHPAFWAGWYGLLVTSLNLLPASMLDGGHAVRAALGPERHRLVSYGGVVLALALGYLPMAVLIWLFLARGHPGPLDDVTPLSPGRVVLGLVLILIFLVSTVPLWSLWWQ
ncbi:MAG: site-2 protease family protein [Armatimonadota bacterium]|nr:site-2 protease family protein [Armatimonadota bacterium]MDR7460581.1 site-2 protease family protein [Armatimonadota bacterium]MDR7480062.1 site-2 protease family protein [Armatimonadota bacterium]MDR7489470.1 site-2 protease family protein [Armatimonadota bacterium]MDR7490691.1 site-2 protease family protein [Armatimonadota bacterium]